jgi:hypothetical protein
MHSLTWLESVEHILIVVVEITWDCFYLLSFDSNANSWWTLHWHEWLQELQIGTRTSSADRCVLQIPVRASGDMTHAPVYNYTNASDWLKIYRPWKLIPLADEDGITRWRRCFKYCVTTQNVAGSIPDCVIGIFHWTNDQIVQKPLPTQHTSNKRTNIHALSGIRTRDPGNGAAVSLCLRSHGHRDTPW